MTVPSLKSKDAAWREFWFEGNTSWGRITSVSQWLCLLDDYARHNPATDPLSAKRGPDRNGLPNFGFRLEHNGRELLRDWLAEG